MDADYYFITGEPQGAATEFTGTDHFTADVSIHQRPVVNHIGGFLHGL